MKEDGAVEPGSPAEPEPSESMIQRYLAILASTQEQVRFSDSKAGFFAAFNTLLFGFSAAHFEKVKAAGTIHEGACSLLSVGIVCLAFYTLSSLASMAYIIYSVVPRLGGSAPLSRVFFGHIATHYGKDHMRYFRDTSRMTTSHWGEEIGTQIVVVSHIALTKHQRIRMAAVFTAIAFAFWVGSILCLPTSPLGGLSHAVP